MIDCFFNTYYQYKFLARKSLSVKLERHIKNVSFKECYKVCEISIINDVVYFFIPVIVFLISTIKMLGLLFYFPYKKDLDRYKGKRLAVLNSKTIYTRTLSQLNEDDFVLLFQTKCNNKKLNFIKMSHLISIQDVFISYIYTLKSIYYFGINEGYSSIMYVMNAFDCFVLMHALSNLPNDVTLFTCSQIDRLAIIIDNAKQVNKQISMHGTLYMHSNPKVYLNEFINYDPQSREGYYKLPIKLKNINTLYAFNEKEAKYFCLSVLGKDNFNGLNVVLVGYYTDFSSIPSNSLKNVLIVLNNEFIELEKMIFRVLSSMDYMFYLQVHPLSNKAYYDDYISDNLIFIVDKNPLVDAVISYDSTLAHEYEDIGIPVIYYMDFIQNNNLNTEAFKNELVRVTNCSL